MIGNSTLLIKVFRAITLQGRRNYQTGSQRSEDVLAIGVGEKRIIADGFRQLMLGKPTLAGFGSEAVQGDLITFLALGVGYELKQIDKRLRGVVSERRTAPSAVNTDHSRRAIMDLVNSGSASSKGAVGFAC